MLLDISRVLVCRAFTTSTVCDICTFAVLCSISHNFVVFVCSYQNSSILQIEHWVHQKSRKMLSKKHKITRWRASKKWGLKSTSRHWLAVIAKRNQAFSIRHKGTHYEKFVPIHRMSYILTGFTYVWVALATSDVQRILEIPATDEIHMEDRNHALAWTKPNSGIYNTLNSW